MCQGKITSHEDLLPKESQLGEKVQKPPPYRCSTKTNQTEKLCKAPRKHNYCILTALLWTHSLMPLELHGVWSVWGVFSVCVELELTAVKKSRRFPQPSDSSVYQSFTETKLERTRAVDLLLPAAFITVSLLFMFYWIFSFFPIWKIWKWVGWEIQQHMCVLTAGHRQQILIIFPIEIKIIITWLCPWILWKQNISFFSWQFSWQL